MQKEREIEKDGDFLFERKQISIKKREKSLHG